MHFNPELIAHLNHRLYGIFQRVSQYDRAAFNEYFDLLLLEAAAVLLSFGVESEECPREARRLLQEILRAVCSQNLPQIASEGAFLWWRKKFRALVARYYD